MIQIEQMKTVALISPISATANGTQSGTVDTQGYNHATILTILDTAATNPTGLVLGDGSVTNSFTDIPAFIGDDTTTGFTIPDTDTDNPQIVRFEVDLTDLERYLELVITAGATQVNSAVCILSMGDTPQTIAGMGVSALVQS